MDKAEGSVWDSRVRTQNRHVESAGDCWLEPAVEHWEVCVDTSPHQSGTRTLSSMASLCTGQTTTERYTFKPFMNQAERLLETAEQAGPDRPGPMHAKGGCPYRVCVFGGVFMGCWGLCPGRGLEGALSIWRILGHQGGPGRYTSLCKI